MACGRSRGRPQIAFPLVRDTCAARSVTDVDDLDHRGDAADTRAGLLLAVAGLLASIGTGGGWPPLAVSARFFAGLAALLAIGALTVPVSAHDVQSSARRQHVPRRGLDLKLARLRLSTRLVTAALAFAVLGVTVEAVRLGGTG